jgi:molybdopterin synthase sulfur carrier subunit
VTCVFPNVLALAKVRKPLDRRKVFCYINTMDIEVRLYANFRDFLPSGSTAFGMKKSLDKDTTIEELVKELGLPEDVPKIVIVNGTHAEFDYVLKDGDTLSVFPPLAGG